jgi:hypothetical protein
VYQIELIETVDGLTDITNEWLDIINTQKAPFLNTHPDIILNLLSKNSINEKKCIVFVLKKNNIIEAIAPCILFKSTFRFRLGLLKFGRFKQNKLTLIGSDLLYSPSSDKNNCVSAFMSHINQQKIMDIFSVDVVAEQSPLGLFLKNSSHWSISHAATNNIVRQLLLPNSHDDYLKAMKRKVRYNIKRNVKQFSEAFEGNIELKVYEHENNVDELLEKVNIIFKKSWQSNVMGYYQRDSEAQIESKKLQARNNWLKSYVLECNNTPVAFVMGTQLNGYYDYEETGFDPEYASFSPGSVMTYLLIEELFKENKPEILNFGFGENVYKKIFGNHSFTAFNIVSCPKSSKANLLLSIQNYLNKTYSLISRLLVKSKLDKHIRKIMKKK